jgi:cytochrome oxidase assembly protein ShyY1
VFFTPRWVASHVFATVLIVSFVFAGLWQVNRLNERRDTNDLIRERLSAAPAEIDRFNEDGPARPEYEIVSVVGEYDASRELLVANRSEGGTPGFWAWTVLSTPSGEILVNRGFVPRRFDANPPFVPQTGEVTVVGLVRFGLSSGGVSDDGTQISRPNAVLALDHLNVDNVLEPGAYVQLLQQDPAQGALPRPVPIPDLGEGPHRSYAFQWFTFATIGLIGYALVLIRIRRGDEALGDVGLADRIDSAHESEAQGV